METNLGVHLRYFARSICNETLIYTLMLTTTHTKAVHQAGENLLLHGNFRKSWSPIDLGTKKSKWILTKAHVIKQENETGNRKNCTGTILLHKSPLLRNSLKLSGQPGFSGQFGMVFNYLSDKNYHLFVIDQYTSKYKGYEVLIAEVREGNFRSLNRDKFDFEASPSIQLKIQSTEVGTTQFFIDDRVIHQNDKVKLGQGLKFGLYSQGNGNGSYHSLVEEDLDLTIPVNGQDKKANGIEDPSATANLNPIQPNDQKLKQTLKINPPQSKTTVEFKQAYKVALDSFYSNLYLNSSLSKPQATNTLRSDSRSVILDYRPNRWYKEIKNIRDAMKSAQYDVKRYEEILEDFENNGTYPEGVKGNLEEMEKHDEKIMEYRKKYLISQDILEQLEDQKTGIEQEMRIDSYMLREDDVPENMMEDGYDFYIAGGVAGYKDFHPINVNPDEDLGENARLGKDRKAIEKGIIR